ncbi:MAG: phosphoribosylanthranilate isomerase [Actinomycetota bacterium]
MFVKICGITSEEDALFATAMGADAVGFIFAPSTRQVSPQQVRDIARRLPPEVLTVGVFRNELPARVIDIVHAARIRVAQLHGHESMEQVRQVAQSVPAVIKAFAAGTPELTRSREYPVDAILVEGASPGSGEVFDWRILDGVDRGHPLLLAGGLHPDNVAEAIRVVRPWGVDVSTGVEKRPGVKDPLKVRAFIRAARAAAEELDEPELVGERPFDWLHEA